MKVTRTRVSDLVKGEDYRIMASEPAELLLMGSRVEEPELYTEVINSVDKDGVWTEDVTGAILQQMGIQGEFKCGFLAESDGSDDDYVYVVSD